MYTSTLYGVLGDDYYAHKVVKSIFPGKVLFQKRDSMVITYSEEKPKICFDEKVKIAKTNEISLSLAENVEVQFSLRANPTKKVNGKRYGLQDNEIKEWLMRKFEGSAEVLVADFNNEGLIRSKDDSLCHLSVRIVGMLRIKDVPKFQDLLKNGIGSGKGLGYGMLYIS